MMLGACASQVTSEVTRFHRDSKPTGETIAISAMDEAKQGSLEFASFDLCWDEPKIYSFTIYPRALDLNIVRSNGESLFYSGKF